MGTTAGYPLHEKKGAKLSLRRVDAEMGRNKESNGLFEHVFKLQFVHFMFTVSTNLNSGCVILRTISLVSIYANRASRIGLHPIKAPGSTVQLPCYILQ